MDNSSRSGWMWMFFLLLTVILISITERQKENENTKELDYSEFRVLVDQRKVQEVKINNREIVGFLKKDVAEEKATKFKCYQPPNDVTLIPALLNAEVKISSSPEEQGPWYLVLLANAVPVFIIIAVWVFFMRQINKRKPQ